MPSRARAVRSVEYFSRAWNWPSGSSVVTLRLPRTDSKAPRTASKVPPRFLERLGGVPGTLGDTGEQHLGGDVGVAEFGGEFLGRGQGVECVPVEFGFARPSPAAVA